MKPNFRRAWHDMTTSAVYLGLFLLALCTAHADVTVLRHYRLGEADAGAANGIIATNSVDSVGGNNLSVFGSPMYSPDVNTTNERNFLSLQFSGTNYGSASLITNLTDNFGVEAWVKTETNSGSHFIVYNGNTGTSGWGLRQADGNWVGLFGGRVFIDSVPAPITVNQWTHLALVRQNGVATLYVDGVAKVTDTTAPFDAEGALAVGAPPNDPTVEMWHGLIDEVRVFTFSAGTFNPSDLLYFSTNCPAITVEPASLSDGTRGVSSVRWQSVLMAACLPPTTTAAVTFTISTPVRTWAFCPTPLIQAPARANRFC